MWEGCSGCQAAWHRNGVGLLNRDNKAQEVQEWEGQRAGWGRGWQREGPLVLLRQALLALSGAYWQHFNQQGLQSI